MTYQVFFNLDDAPFRLPPDPEYYFPSTQHKEALDTLVYCVEAGEGFAQITGEPGVGKTLLIKSFIDQLGEHVNTALILHPRLEAEELFKVILEDLGLAPENIQEMSKEALLRSFRDILLESANKGFQTIIIIDEAQELPVNTLEELRLLSNLETDKKKLLQIILVGQRELEEKLDQPGLKQLQQRITIRYRLHTLSLDETINYILHRLKIAGGGNISRFSPEIIKQIHSTSNGVPRIINTLCERSLMAAFVDGKSTVNSQHLKNALESTRYNAIETKTIDKTSRIQPLYLLIAVLLGFTVLYISNATLRNQINQVTQQLTLATTTTRGSESESAPIRTLSDTKQHKDTPVQKTLKKAKQLESKGNAAANQTSSIIPAQATNSSKKIGSIASNLVNETLPPTISYPSSVQPTSWQSITINPQTGHVKLFLNDQPEPIKDLLLPTGLVLEEGVYLLGYSNNKAFLFNPRSFFSWQIGRPVASWLWKNYTDDHSPPVFPVIVSPTRPIQLSPQTEQISIRATIRNWISAFEEKDIEKLMAYYDNSLITYKTFRNRPTVISHAEVRTKKQTLFSKNKKIALQISDPICIVTTKNPSQGVAFFHQRYTSSTYRDTGIKILYLRKTGSTSPNQPGWIITGKLWIPLKKKTERPMNGTSVPEL